MLNIDSTSIGGRAIEEWDQMWTPVKGGAKVYHPELVGLIGLYRISVRGQIKYIGIATQVGRGLAKRFSDFRRESDSARDHYAGELIHQHLDDHSAEVLIIDPEDGGKELAILLKDEMVELHKPEWNRSKSVCEQARARRQRRGPTLRVKGDLLVALHPSPAPAFEAP